MYKMKLKLYVVILSLFLVACGSKKGIVTKKKNAGMVTEKVLSKPEKSPVMTPKEEVKVVPSVVKPRLSVDDYISNFSDIAKSQMRTSKIPASITLAQGILESGSGNGRLALEANNHFGIKCHGWAGQKIYHDDDEAQECFRKYAAAESSYKDHSEFLTGRERYSKLFLLEPNDYRGWAEGLKAAGYATDGEYPQKLVSLIERYQLHKYDDEVLIKTELIRTTTAGSNVNHTVVKGDTLYSLSRRYDVPVDVLKALNSLKSTDLSIGQVLVLKSK